MESSQLLARASSRASSLKSNKRCSLVNNLRGVTEEIEMCKCRVVLLKSSQLQISLRVIKKHWFNNNNHFLITPLNKRIKDLQSQEFQVQKDLTNFLSRPVTNLLEMQLQLLLMMRVISSTAQPKKTIVIAKQSISEKFRILETTQQLLNSTKCTRTYPLTSKINSHSRKSSVKDLLT